MEIKNTYLMWVGAQHYATIKDYSEEAVSRGISKRIPNPEVGLKLLESGTVIFLAHDEGEYDECPSCVGECECPECRKNDQELADAEERLEEGRKTGTAAHHLKRTEDKVERLQKAIAECPICGGKKTANLGTGGEVTVNGTRWDYRRYTYWLHQPKAWKPIDNQVVGEVQCERCGGTGRLPKGKLFGMFLPAAVEYILKPEDTKAMEAEVKARGIETVKTSVVTTEARRGCGKRIPGGFYVVTRTERTEPKLQEVIDEMVANGIVKPEAVEINGNFARFLAPVDITEKRFRGLKRWNPEPEAVEEAEMIGDAMEE